MPVSDFLHTISRQMSESRSEYLFGDAIGSPGSPPLTVLGLVSKGSQRRGDGEVRLQLKPVPSDHTIGHLAAMKLLYAHPLCIEQGRFVIHIGESQYYINIQKD